MKYRLLLLLFFVQISLFAQEKTKDVKMDAKMAAQKLSSIYYLINNYYVDTADFEALTDDAIVSILKELDPHSAYIPKKDVEKS